MGELDKFVGKGIASKASTGVAKNEAGLPSWAQGVKSPPSSAADDILRQRSARFAIALDATGSMSHLIDMAKASLAKILQRVIKEAGRPVEIMLVAYRDYDVPNDIVVTSPLTGDSSTLVRWLGKIQAMGGGSNDGEAVERALEAIGDAGAFDAVVVAGDEPPNSRHNIRKVRGADAPHAEDFAKRFAQSRTPIHTFVVGEDPRTFKAFATLSSLSGGKTGRLDGSAEMIDMAVMAMLAKLKGSEGVKAYMRDYHVTSRAAADFGKLLLEGPKK